MSGLVVSNKIFKSMESFLNNKNILWSLGSMHSNGYLMFNPIYNKNGGTVFYLLIFILFKYVHYKYIY